MPPTQREYLQSVPVREKPSPIDPQLLKSAAVSAERLTGHPDWDRYLSQLQGKRDEFQKQYEQWRDQLEFANPPERVKECQVNVAIYKNCVALLDDLMALPQQIIKAHHAQP